MREFTENDNTYISYLDRYRLQDPIDTNVTIVEKILYKEDTRYGIYIGENEEGRRFTVCGVFAADLIMYVKYHIVGVITQYKGEKQVSIREYEIADPEDAATMQRILMNLQDMGFYYDQIHAAFASDALKAIQESPEAVANAVEGLRLEVVIGWRDTLNIESSNNEAIDGLVAFGIELGEARNALGAYGVSILQVLKENPYGLIGKIPNLDFPSCDKLALKNGMAYDDIRRVKEAFSYVLRNSESKGHCYMLHEEAAQEVATLVSLKVTQRQATKALSDAKSTKVASFHSFSIPSAELWPLLKKAQAQKENSIELFSPSDGLVGEAIYELKREGSIVIEEGRCYNKDLWEAEKSVALRVVALAKEGQVLWEGDHKAHLASYLDERGMVLEERQEEAVLEITKRAGGFYVIRGGPGSGKTFTAKIVLDMLRLAYQNAKLPLRISVMAPTGKASRAIRNATEYEATTIHRGLGCDAKGEFYYNRENPLSCDVLLLDESSMLDIRLAASLLEAIPASAKVIFIGDTNQLPSIEAGNVLGDIIGMGRIPVFTLNVPKRQLEDSSIVKNCDRMMKGMMIHSDTEIGDTFVIRKKTAETCKKTIVEGVDNGLEIGYNLSEIQILCPMKSGSLGTVAMNHYIQDIYNPKREQKPEVCVGKIQIPGADGKLRYVDSFFRQGDKVIQVRNNYEMEWFIKKEDFGYTTDYERIGISNGECGIIEDIFVTHDFGKTTVEMYVCYDGGFVRYRNDFSEIEHAFAITIHKSQGSQWPLVIMPILSGSDMFLVNSLVYTGFSRAQDISIVIGDPELIARAIKTNINNNRNTTLTERLKNAFLKKEV